MVPCATRLVARTHQAGRAGVIAYLDLDGFKSVNDCAGHAAGDRVLLGFARLLSTIVRSTDCASRFGGDEFVLFLDMPDTITAAGAIQRLLAAVEEGVVQLGHEGLSCSIGAVLVSPTEPLPSIASLIQEADQKMYDSKLAGRQTWIGSGGVHRLALANGAS